MYEHLQPNAYFKKFIDIDFKGLVKKGINYLIIDLDNTLALRHDTYCVKLDILASFRHAKQAGIKGFCLLSNIGVKKQYIFWGFDRIERVAFFASEFNTKYLALVWPDIKPMPAVFYQAMDLLGSNHENTAVIGDQIFTDIKGGNSVGCYTILVSPLGKHHWITYLIKGRREKRVLKYFQEIGLMP